ncbi:hypothetical protein BJ165DRAFT_1599112 [Panaeolus papilionaceus]|nr:hypothetical protein BJ165DRAFT_1599112 [Panaeolus papilionaceus]
MPRSVRKDINIEKFLDLEALVDREENDDSDHDDDLSNFLDDESVDSRDTTCNSSMRLWKDLEDQDENEEIESYIEELAKRSHNDSRSSNVEEQNPGTDAGVPFPIYRVRCQIGMEEEAVFHILRHTRKEHCILSAFSRGTIRGYIYLESTMVPKTHELLRQTPGVIKRMRGEVLKEGVDRDDWPRLLSMRSSKMDATQGAWVGIQRGDHRGDVGLVSLCAGWGVEVLLVPRNVTPNAMQAETSLKRKRTTVLGPAALFNPSEFARHHPSVQLTRIADKTYKAGSVTFQNGLRLKRYDHHSVTTNILSIPSSIFHLFLLSKHPLLSSSPLPRPAEWAFSTNDRVRTRDRRRQGMVKGLGVFLVEVEMENEENAVVALEWKDVRKFFRLADHVQICSGDDAGVAGWIQEIADDIATIISKAPSSAKEAMGNGDDFHISEHRVHINWLKPSSPEYFHSVGSSSDSQLKALAKRDVIPWIGTEIIVSKKGNPWKGYRGVVKDVLCGQSTATTIKVQVQFTMLNFANPFPIATLDYDEVVQSRNGRPLVEFSPHFRNAWQQDPIHQTSMLPPHVPPTNLGTCATPSAPDIANAEAWDPNSRTPVPRSRSASPIPHEDLMLVPSPSSGELLQASTPVPTHPILDQRLLSIPLKVIVNGGDYAKKELVVTVENVEGQLCIHHKLFNTTKRLDPLWVSIQPVNPTRDNGLLVVILGEHCGKYARRIHHRYGETKESVFVQLAVVRRAVSGLESLTDERFELPPTHLCLVSESKEQKILNATLMNSLREQARRVRVRVPP